MALQFLTEEAKKAKHPDWTDEDWKDWEDEMRYDACDCGGEENE